VGRALAVVDDCRMQDYPISGLAFAAAARLAVHRGDPDGAKDQFAKAMRVRPSCTPALPVLAVRLRLQLAKVAWSTGDPTTARHLLREVDDILLHRPSLGALVTEVSELRRMLQSSRPASPAGAPPLTPAELRLLPYLQTHLTIREIAERLFVSRNTVNTELGSIYRKLGVTTRNGAVERSTSMGLLGG
jgi:LuxR family maltose regulon positive regulatory protein